MQPHLEPALQPATPAPLAVLPAEPAPPVPPLLIKRQLQLIETYEAAADQPEAGVPPAAASTAVSGTPAEQPPDGSRAGGPTPAGSAELAVPDPDRAALLRELEATRSELAELSLLMEELPAIFESKFRQRLEPILAEQSRLLADNERLREQLLALPGNGSGSVSRPLLLPELADSPPRPSRRRSRGLGGMFRRAFGLSDRDDGRTTAA